MAGGQPISMANLREVRALSQKHGIRIILDATRAVENAYFIQQREPGFQQKSVAEILREICACTDGCTMSGKKDALVNIGGWLALNDAALYEEAANLVVVYEGPAHLRRHGRPRHGGHGPRHCRIGRRRPHPGARSARSSTSAKSSSTGAFRSSSPIGGHAVYLDAKAFYPHVPQDDFPAQALAAELYVDSGVRAMERGIVSAGRDAATGKHHYPKLELVRLTIPRRVYTQAHMDVTAESVAAVYDNRRHARGLKMVHEPKYLRFFQARFALG